MGRYERIYYKRGYGPGYWKIYDNKENDFIKDGYGFDDLEFESELDAEDYMVEMELDLEEEM
ncbi:MAG: hypothetical protein HUJ59_04390 [Bacilli bacterium]|nr:hypothetical protein [Bacilli bacterium]